MVYEGMDNLNNMLLKDAEELLYTADLANWESIFDLLKSQSNPKIRVLACELLIKQKCYKKLELFLNDKDGHVRKYSNLHYYKRACISKIGEKIIYDFVPYLGNEECGNESLIGEYPYTITIGTTDFNYFFAKHIESCFPIQHPFKPFIQDVFDHTSTNYIPKKEWVSILPLIYKSIENYSDDYRCFAVDICQWIELKLDLSDGIYIFGNL